VRRCLQQILITTPVNTPIHLPSRGMNMAIFIASYEANAWFGTRAAGKPSKLSLFLLFKISPDNSFKLIDFNIDGIGTERKEVI